VAAGGKGEKGPGDRVGSASGMGILTHSKIGQTGTRRAWLAKGRGLGSNGRAKRERWAVGPVMGGTHQAFSERRLPGWMRTRVCFADMGSAAWGSRTGGGSMLEKEEKRL